MKIIIASLLALIGVSSFNDPQRDAIVMIMHRLHPSDLCGVIEQLVLPYVKLVLPMEYVRSVTVKTPSFEDPRNQARRLPAHRPSRWRQGAPIHSPRL